jgi:hypothetical protein
MGHLQPPPSSKNVLTHVVLLRIREDVPANTIERVFGEIGALQSKIAGILSYTWGPYSSPESGPPSGDPQRSAPVPFSDDSSLRSSAASWYGLGDAGPSPQATRLERQNHEPGYGRGYTHGFCMTFVDAAARDAYLPHPEHREVWTSVSAIVDGGVNGVLAFDFAS